METFDCDALVMVHPDGGKPFNPEYVHNLADAVRLCRVSGKHIFVITNPYIDNAEISGILSGAHELPLEDETYPQSVIDFIAGKVGKKPEEITLGFGGTYAEACVLQHATDLCRSVETNYRPENPAVILHYDPPEHPISFGKVIDELV